VNGQTFGVAVRAVCKERGDDYVFTRVHMCLHRSMTHVRFLRGEVPAHLASEVRVDTVFASTGQGRGPWQPVIA